MAPRRNTKGAEDSRLTPAAVGKAEVPQPDPLAGQVQAEGAAAPSGAEQAPPAGNVSSGPEAGATSDGGPEADGRADLLKAAAEIGAADIAPVIPAGMTLEIRPIRRAATVASTIKHDGEGFLPDDTIFLTEVEFLRLVPTGALVEDHWDDLSSDE